MSEKIKPQHTSRKAILYVPQSSPYQVLNNLESQKLQYAMESHLRSLGWNEVEIIDEDLGRSAGGTVTRTGFERMVAQVCMGEIGAVCAREVSRFARNSREWQQLVEVCRIVDTVLVDQETVYSPRLGNDRLLLGLKGTLNEYELDLLRQRASEARVEKARRGDLVSHCPVGFVKDEDGVIVHCDLNVLLRPQVTLSGLDRGVPEQELDLLEIAAVLAAELRASPTEVVGAEVLDPDLLR